MQRVQTLSALTAVSNTELKPVEEDLKKIAKLKGSEYDANTAAFLIQRSENESSH